MFKGKDNDHRNKLCAAELGAPVLDSGGARLAHPGPGSRPGRVGHSVSQLFNQNHCRTSDYRKLQFRELH